MSEVDFEYEGNPLQLNMCYKNLKQALRNPVVVHNNGHEKPHHLKMTFCMMRNAVNGERFLEMSKLTSTASKILNSDDKSQSHISKVLPPLMRAGKEMNNEMDDISKVLFGS